jgi:hypothetical protein
MPLRQTLREQEVRAQCVANIFRYIVHTLTGLFIFVYLISPIMEIFPSILGNIMENFPLVALFGSEQLHPMSNKGGMACRNPVIE